MLNNKGEFAWFGNVQDNYGEDINIGNRPERYGEYNKRLVLEWKEERLAKQE